MVWSGRQRLNYDKLGGTGGGGRGFVWHGRAGLVLGACGQACCILYSNTDTSTTTFFAVHVNLLVSWVAVLLCTVPSTCTVPFTCVVPFPYTTQPYICLVLPCSHMLPNSHMLPHSHIQPSYTYLVLRVPICCPNHIYNPIIHMPHLAVFPCCPIPI